jgi:hypothetical protein
MREGDWELCKELARFLAALDETGDTLRDALHMVGVSGMGSGARSSGGIGLGIQMSNGRLDVPVRVIGGRERRSGSGSGSPDGSVNGSSASTLGRESRRSESDGELASLGAGSEDGSLTSGG